ncbi:hypothetical protein [Salinarimonas soli]|uniref:Uncharacterized protein n=1 Tax=Salinarimonas soli TaxID=1638099 RepID=A0A5B2VD21_9HYPH|nr:hypothetical protein [Salinarimonas soli]KAA2236961.1 hypothetical protein F0L46_11860 [Salinarimonas soli]
MLASGILQELAMVGAALALFLTICAIEGSSYGCGSGGPASGQPPPATCKAEPVQGPMFWRFVFLYAGSAALLAYSLGHMPR